MMRGTGMHAKPRRRKAVGSMATGPKKRGAVVTGGRSTAVNRGARRGSGFNNVRRPKSSTKRY
jgi:hypothetical protein